MTADRSINIVAVGSALPRTRHRVVDLARQQGADPSAYAGWEHVHVADDDQHPSTLATQAMAAALDAAGMRADQLDLVLAVGVSKDYLPSWSLAAECMKALGVARGGLAVDLTAGCLGGLIGLDFARDWLTSRGARAAAIIASEKWAYTVDRKTAAFGLWAHSDGAAVAIVTNDPAPRALARYAGASYETVPHYNGMVFIKYGGTRFPIPPDGTLPYTRVHREGITHREIQAHYSESYARVLATARARIPDEPRWLLCNQISPAFVKIVAETARVGSDRIWSMGHETGHLGSADVFVGLDSLVARNGPLAGPVLVAGSTPCEFGAGWLLPPGGP